MKSRVLSLFALCLLAATTGFSALAADTSQTISFGGCDTTLTGTVDLRLRLFTDSVAGSLAFEETQTVTVDPSGCFFVLVGNATALSASLFTANPSLWVAFALDATPDSELGGGRVPISANGYAFRAQTADNAQTLPGGSVITANQSGPGLTVQNSNPAGNGLRATGGNVGLEGTGASIGTLGRSSGASGRGVAGVADAATGVNYGVSGEVTSTTAGAAGVYGRGSASGNTSGVMGESPSATGFGVYGIASAGTASAGVKGMSTAPGGNGVIGEANNGFNAFGVWGKSTGGFAGYFDGKLQVNGATAVNGQLTASNAGDAVNGTSTLGSSNAGVRGLSTAPGGNGVIGEANNGTAAYGVWGRSTTGFAGYFDGKVQVNGNMIARVVQITGADLSEKFEIQRGQTEIQPGLVVSIAPGSPGKLAVSAKAYDRRVAGIISGAGGVTAGVLMGQPGTLADGDYPVALSGRVYVWADASNGPIAGGDLLTTSRLPGHAMKVKDHVRAQGAILGKAITGLSKGRGLVLVLVTLQ